MASPCFTELNFALDRDRSDVLSPGLVLDLVAVSARSAGLTTPLLRDFWVVFGHRAESIRVVVLADGEVRVHACVGASAPIIGGARLQLTEQGSAPAGRGGRHFGESNDRGSAQAVQVPLTSAPPSVEDTAYCLNPVYFDAAAEKLGLTPGPGTAARLVAESVLFVQFGSSPTEMQRLDTEGGQSFALLAGSVPVAVVHGLRADEASWTNAPDLETLVGLLAQICPGWRCSSDDELAAFGISSLELVRFRGLLEERFGYAPTLRELVACPTLAAVHDHYRLHPGGTVDSWPTLVRTAERSRWPLTPAQQQLWIRQQSSPRDAAYNLVLRARFATSLQARALEGALQALLRRHDVLRAPVQVDRGGCAYQVVAQEISCPILQACEDPEAVLRREREPFDLTRAPLVRATLRAVGDGGCEVSLVVAHICVDGSAVPLLLRDLGHLYAAEIEGREANLPAPRVAFSQAAWWYASEQVQARLDASVVRAATGLVGAEPPQLALSAVAVESDLGAEVVDFGFSEAEHSLIVEASREQGITPHSFFLAVYALVLRFHTGNDPLVQLVSFGRPTRWSEECVGLFANPVLCACQISRAGSVSELLRIVADRALGALEEQHAPYQDVMARLSSDADAQAAPCEVGMLYRADPLGSLEFAGARGALITPRLDSAPDGTARLDLELVIDVSAGSAKCQLVFRPHALTSAAAERFAACYRLAAKAMVAEPAATIEMLRARCDQRLPDLRSVASGPFWDLAESPSVPERIWDQATKRPNAVAVHDGAETVSYGELLSESERLAAHLRESVPAGATIAMDLPRDHRMVVGIVAALMAGCRFVPMDWRQPPVRLRRMLEQCNAAAVLVAESHLARAVQSGLPLVRYEGVSESQGRPVPAARDAYVMFTSGSTGEPKGVVVTLRNLDNFFLAMDALLSLRAPPVWLAVTTPTFDISLLELLYPLTVGGSVVVGPQADGEVLDLRALDALACSANASCFQTTPSLLAIVLSEAAGRRLVGRLETLLVGGEALPLELARRVREIHGGAMLNMYGPTETTIWSSAWQVPKNVSDVRVGRPLLNTHLRVCDTRGEVVPKGVPGELWIGGEGVAAGYQGREDLTAERFVAEPRSQRRWYRTGDRVRLDERGEVQWLGRLDRQIKVGGRRLEPAEIERVLEAHPRVDKCAVAFSAARGEASATAFVAVKEQRASLEERAEAWALHATCTEAGPPTSPGSASTPGPSRRWFDPIAGEAIPEPAQVECISSLLRRLELAGDERVVEVADGAGELAAEILTNVRSYRGLEPLGRNVRSLSKRFQGCANADIEQMFPHAPGAFPANECDRIIFNAVVAGFPNAAYLHARLVDAYRGLSAAGRILVADVPNWDLQRAWTLLRVLGEGGDQTVGQIETRAQRLAHRERALLVRPDFFWQLGGPYAARLKRGRFRHGLNRYRYDALLGADPVCAISDPRSLAWTTFDELLSLAKQVARTAFSVVVRGIPNARLAAEAALVGAMGELPVDAAVVSLKERVHALRRPALDPEVACLAVERLGLAVEPLVSTTGGPFAFDLLVFERPSQAPLRRASLPQARLEACSSPDSLRQDDLLASELRGRCEQSLPSYLVPQRIEFLQSLPLTPNGKVDHGRLGQIRAAISDGGSGRMPASGAEERVAALFEEVLGVARVAATDDFFTLGGGSLAVVRLVSCARERGVAMSASMVFEARTVERLAQAGAAGDAATGDTSEVEVLDFSAVASTSDNRWAVDGRALLTGATGYVGAFLLAALLREGRCREVLCLVRAADEASAFARLHANAERWKLDSEIPWSRVRVQCGDLELPKLGLDPAGWGALPGRFDIVVHSGARVHFLDPYSRMRPANVEGTVTLLRLAMAKPASPFHFVSSIAAVGHDEDALPEECIDPIWPTDGYGRSKREAEEAVNAAGRAGLPVAIYRLGLVAADTHARVAATDDALFRCLHGVLQLGAAFAAGGAGVLRHVVPVDWVADALVALAQRGGGQRLYHLAPPGELSFPTLVDWLAAAGSRVEIVPHDEWLSRLTAESPLNDLAPLLGLFRDEAAIPHLLARVDQRSTGRELAALGIDWPRLDRHVIAAWVQLLRQSGPAHQTADVEGCPALRIHDSLVT